MTNDLANPFNGAPSIYSRIVEAAVRRGDAAKSLDLTLPEQGQLGKGLRVVGGGLDALFGGADSSPKQTKARTLVASVTKAIRQPSANSFNSLYLKLKACRASEVVDEALSRLQPELALRRGAMATLARKLVREAPDMEPAKIGIAMLGISGDASDEGLLIEIGQSEEMTLFSVVALSNLLDDPQAAIWKLAQRVHGWGRIAAVERLEGTNDDAIRAWLLRDGFRNEIMNEYLACLAAKTGGLSEALAVPEINDELLVGASDIIAALICGGPAEDIFDYADSADACVSFLSHALTRERPVLKVISTAVDLKRLVDGEQSNRLRTTGWTAQALLDVRTRASALVQKPGARDVVVAGLAGNEPWGAPMIAAAIAPQFGIDPWPRYLERQQQRIGENWWYLMQTDDPVRVEQVLELVRNQIDLAKVGSGPTDSLGLGQEFRDDSAMDFVVQDLKRFPGQGWDLIEIGLRARTVRLRNMAINALRDWGRDAWPAGAEKAVKEALAREPEGDVRDRFRLLLVGRLKD